MATTKTILESLALITENWPRAQTDLRVEIFNQVMADVEDGDLMAATMRQLRGDREYPPTPGIIRTEAKAIENERLRYLRQQREKAGRETPTPTTLRIEHDQHTEMNKIQFNGDWDDYDRRVRAQAAVEWEVGASWCPGQDNFDYRSLGGPYADGKKKGPNQRNLQESIDE